MTPFSYSLRRLVLLVLAGVLLAACAETTAPPTNFVTTPVPGTPEFAASTSATDYPAPAAADASVEASDYPAPSVPANQSADGRSQTALASYETALSTAREQFDPQAELYAIVPSQIMIGNLGSPPVLPGWFYRFKVPGSPRQFIVQVIDGKLSGTTQAEPVAEPTPVEQPINMDTVKVDSDAVLQQFRQAQPDRAEPPANQPYDLELVHLQGTSGPIWSVVDPQSKAWLYSVDASNGQEVPVVRQ